MILHIYSLCPLAFVLSRSLRIYRCLHSLTLFMTLQIFERNKVVLHISSMADFKPSLFEDRVLHFVHLIVVYCMDILEVICLCG